MALDKFLGKKYVSSLLQFTPRWVCRFVCKKCRGLQWALYLGFCSSHWEKKKKAYFVQM